MPKNVAVATNKNIRLVMPYRNVNVFSSDSKFNLLKWDWLVAEASQSTSTRDSTRAVEQLSKWTSIQKRFYCNSSVNPSANWAPELEGDCTHTNTGASTKTTWICLTVWSLDCYRLVMCSLLPWIKLSCTGRMDIGFSSEKHWRTLQQLLDKHKVVGAALWSGKCSYR